MARVVTRAEVLQAQRWTRRHATGALFGEAPAYGQLPGPAPGAGVLVGALVAGVVWVAPVVVDAVRAGTPPAPVSGAPRATAPHDLVEGAGD